VTVLPVRQGRAYPHTQNAEPNLVAALPDWDDLRVLLSVVQTGSFSRTAKTLGLTQPTVSRRVARLEKMVGAQLVDRSNNGAALTLQGQKVIEELRIAHGAIDRAVNRARSSMPRSEPLTLLTTDGIAAYWLSHFLPFLFDRHLDYEFRAITASDASILERSKFDLMIHYMQPNDPNLMTVRLGTLHFVPFASHTYIARHCRPRDAADLARHRLLDYSLYLIDKGTWMTRLPAMAEEARAQLFTNSSSALAESVRHGAGIALLPTYGLVFEKGFEALDVGLHFATPFWLCYHKDALAKQSARIAIQFLKHIFNRKTMPWFADQFVSPDEFPAITPAEVMASFFSNGTTSSTVALG
jgi:molybdate transport repressor ModE-like protein